MASSNQGTGVRPGSTGRGFASLDPERQSEVPATAWGPRPLRTVARPVKTGKTDWMRAQPDRDVSYEGSSSRRSR